MDVDSIMALSNQIRDNAQGSMDAPFWRHVAAAVERLFKDNETVADLAVHHNERAERAERERDELRALLKEASHAMAMNLKYFLCPNDVAMQKELLSRIDAALAP